MSIGWVGLRQFFDEIIMCKITNFWFWGRKKFEQAVKFPPFEGKNLAWLAVLNLEVLSSYVNRRLENNWKFGFPLAVIIGSASSEHKEICFIRKFSNFGFLLDVLSGSVFSHFEEIRCLGIRLWLYLWSWYLLLVELVLQFILSISGGSMPS